MLVCLGLLVMAFVAFNVLTYRQARSMIYFATATTELTQQAKQLSLGQKLKVLFNGITLPRPETRVDISELGPDSQSLTIPVTNGLTLGAWYCPGTNTHQLVVLFHGYSGEKARLLPEARVFLNLGDSVLLVDFRGSGDSSAAYTTIGHDEGEDAAAALRFARDRFHPDTIVAYGLSMGAAAIFRAVHDYGAQPDGIISEAVFDKLAHTMSHRLQEMGIPAFPTAPLILFWGGWQAGFNGFKNNPVDFAPSVQAPILFFHGTDDIRALPSEARSVYDAVPGAQKWFVEFPGVLHEAALPKHPQEWTQAVQEFLNRVQAEKKSAAPELLKP